MTLRSDLGTIADLSAQLDKVNAALAILVMAGVSIIDLTITAPNPAGGVASMRLPVSITNATVLANLNTFLTNRQAALTAQLAALGVS